MNLVNPYVYNVIFDVDALAFIVMAGIINNDQKTAVNKLVLDLKSAGLWTKMKAIYPMVGGNSTAHKFNLKDPRDLDIAYRLVFNGGWTHSSTGALPNGTSGYADTKMNALSSLSLTNTHFAYYSRTQSQQSNDIVMGANSASIYLRTLAALSFSRTTTNASFFAFTGQTNASDLALYTGSLSTQGFLLGSRTSSSAADLKLYINASLAGAATTNTGTYALPSYNVFIGAMSSNDSPLYFTNKECAFASIGDGLNGSESLSLYNIVQTYQTSLGRNV